MSLLMTSLALTTYSPPLNEIANAQAFLAQQISDQIESDVAAWLTATVTASTTATDNGNAGGITEQRTASGNTVSVTAPYATSTNDEDIILNLIDDFVLKAKRRNLIDGRQVYGQVPASLWMQMAPELFRYHVNNRLRDKGYSLDSLTSSTLTEGGVLSGEAFRADFGIDRLTITAPNALSVPATGGTDDWHVLAGYSESMLGGIGVVFSQIIEPEENQRTDGATVRQVVNPYYNLLNGDGLIRYRVRSAA